MQQFLYFITKYRAAKCNHQGSEINLQLSEEQSYVKLSRTHGGNEYNVNITT